ncbi:EamA-like transporter family protein [Gemmobacter aquatilis]|uniref:EamA-like transporter family protein n=1 Tax=Gemmobacter aquatilis TaxID=933059 RepID=A0A1H8NQ58_9RHOB|nr:DMT family transporter [Gemmobacter aquatilis]SEO31689.1 EamA-like transporter family protein [Gemmobacter aquatilis]
MALSDNMRGAVMMNVAMCAFTVNDTCMKLASAGLPLFQVITLRGVLTTAVLAIIAARQGVLGFVPRGADAAMISVRSLAEVLATLTFLIALTQLPLATLSAIMQSLPLAVTLAAALIFHERLGWRRLLAVAIGFAGVMLIIRPGGAGFDRWSLLGLASVACVVARDLSTRRLSRHTPSATVALWAAVAVTAMGAVVSGFSGWAPVSLEQAALILGASAALIVGYLTVVMTMRVGDIGFVAPFRYMALFWAILLGFLVFGSVPDGWTLIGASIVVATGLFTLWRERRLAQG